MPVRFGSSSFVWTILPTHLPPPQNRAVPWLFSRIVPTPVVLLGKSWKEICGSVFDGNVELPVCWLRLPTPICCADASIVGVADGRELFGSLKPTTFRASTVKKYVVPFANAAPLFEPISTQKNVFPGVPQLSVDTVNVRSIGVVAVGEVYTR